MHSSIISGLYLCSCSSLCVSSAALQALKRKKRYEKQLEQIDGTLSTIEFQRDSLENANTNTEVLKNMGYAAKAMKAAHEMWVQGEFNSPDYCKRIKSVN